MCELLNANDTRSVGIGVGEAKGQLEETARHVRTRRFVFGDPRIVEIPRSLGQNVRVQDRIGCA